MDIDIRNDIELYINLLSKTLDTDGDYQIWMPNCIECLQFALDNEQLLSEKPSLYDDTLHTLALLYSWIFKNDTFAYVLLKQKFRKIYSGKEIGNAFKLLFERMNTENTTQKQCDDLLDFIDKNGEMKSLESIFGELNKQWELLSK